MTPSSQKERNRAQGGAPAFASRMFRSTMTPARQQLELLVQEDRETRRSQGDLAEGDDVSFAPWKDRSLLPHSTFIISFSQLDDNKDAIASSKFVIRCTGAMKRTHGCDVERR